MNDKDKEAFRKWFYSSLGEQTSKAEFAQIAWQVACKYKDKEIELLNNEISWLEEKIDDFMDEPDITIKKLQAENKKLREALSLVEMANCYTDYEDAVNIARDALKE